MRCVSQLVDSYINDHIQDMLRFTKSMSFDSPMRAKQRRLKAANKKRTQDEREWEAARAEKQMLGNLADRLKGKIGCAVNYPADEGRARYVQEKMATVELMEEDTSRLSWFIALAEARLHGKRRTAH